jgi:hypothetical protein
MVFAFPFSHAPQMVAEQASGPSSFRQGQVVMPWVNLRSTIQLKWWSMD